MAHLGDYADILRVIGRFLDAQKAQNTEIIEHEMFMAISWQQPGGGADKRTYSELDLGQLRAQAQLLRGMTGNQFPGERAELLRTLGQVLDEEGVVLNGLTEDQNGYRVTGVANRRYVNAYYPKADLRALSQRRQRMRGAPKPTS